MSHLRVAHQRQRRPAQDNQSDRPAAQSQRSTPGKITQSQGELPVASIFDAGSISASDAAPKAAIDDYATASPFADSNPS
jgi:hypothetical protein